MPDPSREILDRIADLDKRIETFISTQHEICRGAGERLTEHHKSLYGDRGVVTRLQTVEGRQNFIWVGVVAFIAGLARFCWQLLEGKP